jgi:hypothetical protein
MSHIQVVRKLRTYAADACKPRSVSLVVCMVGGCWDSPDHEFIITTALVVVGVSSREDVVSNVGANISVREVPLDARRHALDLAHVEATRKLLAHVGVALNIVLAALPCPGRAPAHTGPGGGFHGCALRPGACGAFAPVVVVELVAIRGVVGVLRAEGCCLATHWCHGLLNRSCDWAGGSEGQETGEGNGLEKHLGR